MKILTKRYIALGLAAAVIVTCCSGCQSIQSFFRRTAAYQFFNPPTLVMRGEWPLQTPNVADCKKAEQINSQLDDFFAPVIALVSAADMNADYLYTDAVVEGTGGSYTLTSRLVGRSGASIKLPDIVINTMNGNVTLPELPDLSYITDGAFIDGCLRLSSLGLPYDFSGVDNDIGVSEMHKLLIDYYETMIGGSVNTSRFVNPEDYNDVFMKAIALDITYDSFEGYVTSNQETVTTDLSRAIRGIATALINDYCGIGITGIDRDEAIDMTRLFLELYDPVGNLGQPSNWNECINPIRTISSSDLVDVLPHDMNRQSFANLYVSLYESFFSPIEQTLDSSWLYDTEDVNCLKCYFTSIIADSPSGGIFSPEYTCCMDDLPTLAQQFAESCYFNWLGINNYEYSDYCDYGDVVSAIGNISALLDQYPKFEGDRRIVINSRPYDWYISQFNTGEYSQVNCMPTITGMAVKWYHGENYPVSVKDIRELYLPEYDDGWYMSQVMDSLEHYDVPYEQLDFVLDEATATITAELDKGHIILTQMSEAEIGYSGHCFIIYGYERIGDSLYYYVNDPGIYDGTDEYGVPPGKELKYNGRYAEWLIDRIAYYMVSVGDTVIPMG